MKAKKLTTISLTILAVMLLGAFVLNAFSAPPELKLKVKWKPAAYIIDNPVPNPWKAEIYFAPPRPVTDIDPSSLLLEDVYSPSEPPYLHPLKDRLVVPFLGGQVYTAAMIKIGHISPGSYIVYLEISGRLNDGRSFRGKGSLNITMAEFPPPEP